MMIRQHPDKFKCSISLTLLSHPVVAEDSHIYDKAAIATWINLAQQNGE
jgi:hypothetical protein